MEQAKYKQQTLGITISHHPQMGPFCCRKTSSGLPLILHYGELYHYFIIYYKVIVTEIKCTVNVMGLNHPETIPPPTTSRLGPWNNCLPQNQSLVPERLGTAASNDSLMKMEKLFILSVFLIILQLQMLIYYSALGMLLFSVL